MFRDGIFENFGDFLDKIKESTTNTKKVFEEIWKLESEEEEIASQELSGIAEQALDGDLGLQGYLKNLWEESWERIKEKLETEGSTWYVWWMDGVREHMKNQLEVEESKDQEPDRKDAEQTMKPQEETPKDDAERLSMEDWSDTDKEGKPKRKDKVEYPSKLQQLTDKNQKQDVKNESRKEPLYLCNSCSKTFRNKQAICTFCESKEVESLSKIKEDGSDVPLSKNVFSVQYILNGKEGETRVMAFDDADARRYVEKWKRGSKVTNVQQIGESKVKEDLGIPGQHQLKIAKDTLRMSDSGAKVMGGMTKEEAREFLKKIGWSDKKIAALEESKLQEQGDVEALRAKKLGIEQRMLDAEKKYRDEQNRMGSEVDALNKQISAKQDQKKE